MVDILDDIIADVEGRKTASGDPELSPLLNDILGDIQGTPRPPEPTFGTESTAVVSQFNQGLANLLGLPVDIVNTVLQGAESITGTKLAADVPFGGSEAISRGMQALGIPTGVEPETATGQFAGRVAQELGATAVPAAGIVGGATRLARSSVPIVQQIGRAAAETPGRFLAAETAAATGAGIGAETARTIAPGSPTAEIIGQLAGGVTPALATGVVRRGLRGPQEAAEEALGVFEQAGVQPTAAEISTGGAGRAISSAIDKIPGGGVVRNSIVKVNDKIRNVVQRVTGSEELSVENAGRVIREGLEDEGGFLERFRNEATVKYRAMREKVGDALPVNVQNTGQVLDELSAPIEGAENLSKVLSNEIIQELGEALAKDIDADGNLPFAALRSLRTVLGQRLASKAIIADEARGELKKVYKAISDDIRVAAEANGALDEFNTANEFWSSGIKKIDDQLRPILNKADPEDMFLLATAGKEGATRIRVVRESLKPEQWDIVARTVLRRFGRAAPGQQDAFGEGFSTERFLTQLNRLAPEARDALFKGVGTLKKDVDNIAQMADLFKQARAANPNFSGTAQGAGQIAAAVAATGSMVTGDITPVAIAGLVMISANAAGRLMASPRFVKWLARSSAIKPENAAGHMARLSNISKDNPELAPDIAEYVSVLSGEE